VETPIGRCSLCAGTVVREDLSGPNVPKTAPRARCLDCGATEAPPEKTIKMELRTLSAQLDAQKLNQNDLLRKLQEGLAKRQEAERFLPQAPRDFLAPYQQSLVPAYKNLLGARLGQYPGALGHLDT
jgi:hypothetical protein